MTTEFTLRERQQGESNRSYLYYDGSLFSTHDAYFFGVERTWSRGNAFPPRKSDHRLIDRGGPFLSTKRIISSEPFEIGVMAMQYGGKYREYRNLKIYPGGLGNKSYTKDNLRADVPTLNQMNALGATGIARAQPLKEQGGLGTFIAELRDLPQLPLSIVQGGNNIFRGAAVYQGNYWERIRDVMSFFRDIGGNYLNYQFGWVPFVADIKSSIDNVLKMDEKLGQLLRDNGRVIRRHSVIVKDDPKIVSMSSSNFAVGYPVVESEFIGTYGKLKYEQTTNQGSQFSGAFKYYLEGYRHGQPMTKKLRRKLLRILYGADFSPAQIWAAMPWSWLIDWGANIRDNVKNFQALHQDGLVIVYGYVNDFKETVDKWTLTGANLGGREVGCTQSDTNRYFARTPSTPYGVGLTRNQFTVKQGSIIAALGLSNLQPQQFR